MSEHASADRRFMRRALREATKGHPSPNPRVGAVVVRDGRLLSVGHQERPADAHAEVGALRHARDAGHETRGATLYVSFEPCNHHHGPAAGPCTEAILAAGVTRVVVGCRDPHPRVPGAIERLRDAGVEVEVGVLGDVAEELVTDFVKHHAQRVPYVVAKAALTLDGRMATASGSSKWITGESARRHAHRMRAASDAVLVGVRTVLADDPALTVRLEGYSGPNPLRIVLDTGLRIPLDSALVRTARQAPTLVFHGPGVPGPKLTALHTCGVETVELPLACGHVELEAMLAELGRRNVVRLLVEGGARVLEAMFVRGLVDRVAAFVAPKIAGDPAAVVLAAGVCAKTMDEALALERVRVRRFGSDVLIEGDVPVGARKGGTACSPA